MKSKKDIIKGIILGIITLLVVMAIGLVIKYTGE